MELAQFEKKLKDENLLKIYDRGSWKTYNKIINHIPHGLENVFGTGEMVLESTGKESLPLSNENYMTYRYSVDKDCNIKLYNVYD